MRAAFPHIKQTDSFWKRREIVELSSSRVCLAKSHSFLTKWWDLLDLNKQRQLLGMVYICPIGSCGGMNNLFS